MTRIVSAEATKVAFRLVEGYRIAGRHFTTADMVLLKLVASDGLTGYGCGAPSVEVTGETPDETLRVLRDVLIPLAREPRGPWKLIKRAAEAAPAAPAARAALDMAFLDLEGKRAGLPVASLLGSDRFTVETSITLGIEDDVAPALAAARRRASEGFRILKIKIGEDWEHDLALVRALRETLGPAMILRADGNEGYDERAADSFLRGAADLDLELLEQPVPAEDLDAMARLAASTTVPIMADEALLTEEDAAVLIAKKAAALFNIKLMKSGGMLAGLQIGRRAEAAGIGVMVGCNDESRIAIAAGLHFALALPAGTRADLDGHLDLQDDVARGGVRLLDGALSITGAPGLGVDVDF